jgi:hypothetical protein
VISLGSKAWLYRPNFHCERIFYGRGVLPRFCLKGGGSVSDNPTQYERALTTGPLNESAENYFRFADHPGVEGLRSGLLRFFIFYVEVRCEGQRESLEALRDPSFRDSDSGCQNACTLSERGLIDPPKIDVSIVIYRRAWFKLPDKPTVRTRSRKRGSSRRGSQEGDTRRNANSPARSFTASFSREKA